MAAEPTRGSGAPHHGLGQPNSARGARSASRLGGPGVEVPRVTVDDDAVILVQEYPECMIVSFLKEHYLDFDVIEKTGQALEALIEKTETPNLILSMPQVKQMSSMAISVLIRAHQGCQAKGGSVRLVNVSERGMAILDPNAQPGPVFEQREQVHHGGRKQ